jgi:hypothetical protein
MQADGRSSSAVRLRAVAVLVTCLLGLTLGTTVHAAAQGHRHIGHGIAVAATPTADSPHLNSRTDHGTMGTTSTAAAPAVSRSGTADSSTSASRLTAQAPPVRGPPAKAVA